jgi:hypothetical protein
MPNFLWLSLSLQMPNPYHTPMLLCRVPLGE